jgi:SAM-dependent methyltransferase
MSAAWYEDFFDERYLDFYPVLRERPVALEEARVVAQLLALEPGAAVLDLGCGTGRHAVALAKLGFEVTGVDLSPVLLAQARRTAAAEGVAPRWLQRDMRQLQDVGPFDACVSLYTAFGFLGDEEDGEVLRQIAATLRPGGRLLLDLTNFLGFLRRFPPEVWHESEQALLRERNLYEAETGVLVTRRTAYLKRGGQIDLPASRVRAYLPHEVRALLGRAGLHVERVLGALADRPFSWADSPNQVYLCTKPIPTGQGC